MGRTISIDSGEGSVTTIEWINNNGDEEFIRRGNKDPEYMVIKLSGFGGVQLFREDIPKLYKALGLAMQEGWCDD